MKQTKERKKIGIKTNKGITLVSLIIIIIILFIITSTTIYTSFQRSETNRLKKMYNDLEFLENEISNYYLKYNGIPVVRNSSGPIKYTYSSLDFTKNNDDNENYYIIDLSAIGNVSLNYGKEGFQKPNASDDVYIINEASHAVYYVKGITVEGILYHSLPKETEVAQDNASPTKPEIKIISGEQNAREEYITEVDLEFVPGKDNWSGIEKTTYSVNGSGIETDITTLNNHIYHVSEDGTYTIELKSYDHNGNVSSNSITFMVKIPPVVGDFIRYNVAYTDMVMNYEYDQNNGWRILKIKENEDGSFSDIQLISTGLPANITYAFTNSTRQNTDWWVTDDAKLTEFREVLGGSEYALVSDTNTDNYYNLQAAAGLYYHFSQIKFAYGETERGSNLGYFKKIVTNGTTYNSTNPVETTAEKLFNLYQNQGATLRILTLREVNENLGNKDIDAVDPVATPENDSKGLYGLRRVANVITDIKSADYMGGTWYVASPNATGMNYLRGINGAGNVQSNWDFGFRISVRPVITLNRTVQLTRDPQTKAWVIK